MGDDGPDDAGDGAWLTYDQIAASRRITRRAAVRMTQRHRLRRQPGNDGLIRVWVPHDMAEPSQRVTPRHDARDDGDDDARDGGLTEAAFAAMQSAHERETTVLRERAEAAERREGRCDSGPECRDRSGGSDRRAAQRRCGTC